MTGPHLSCLGVFPFWEGPTHQPEDQPSSEQPCLPGLGTSIVTVFWARMLVSERLSGLLQSSQMVWGRSEVQAPLPLFPATVTSHTAAQTCQLGGAGRGQSESDTALRERTAWGGQETRNPQPSWQGEGSEGKVLQAGGPAGPWTAPMPSVPVRQDSRSFPKPCDEPRALLGLRGLRPSPGAGRRVPSTHVCR